MRLRLRGCVFRAVAAGVAVAGLLALSVAPATAAVEKKPIKIAVGGASCLCYLPTVLAKQLGEFDKAGLDAELINFKGGSVALTAVLGGSADIVSGYYDHTVNLAAKHKEMQAIVVYDHLPALELVVAPKFTNEIKTIADLKGKPVGVTAPGSSTDFMLKYALHKAGMEPNSVSVVGVGQEQTAVAALEQGSVVAAVTTDPVVTMMQNKYKDFRILIDTRTEKDTRALFGSDYPGGSLYTQTSWIEKHPDEAQALADAMVGTLRWIHSHSAEEIMAKMPKENVGSDPDLYLAALKHTIPIYSKDGRMSMDAAKAVLAVFSQSLPEVANAHIDLSKTFTNKFVDAANKKLGATQ